MVAHLTPYTSKYPNNMFNHFTGSRNRETVLLSPTSLQKRGVAPLPPYCVNFKFGIIKFCSLFHE